MYRFLDLGPQLYNRRHKRVYMQGKDVSTEMKRRITLAKKCYYSLIPRVLRHGLEEWTVFTTNMSLGWMIMVEDQLWSAKRIYFPLFPTKELA